MQASNNMVVPTTSFFQKRTQKRALLQSMSAASAGHHPRSYSSPQGAQPNQQHSRSQERLDDHLEASNKTPAKKSELIMPGEH